MKILIACEFSGVVRNAFLAKGHDAWSCDLLPTESPGPHIQGDVLEVLNQGWDLMIAHPPCTYLAVFGNRSFVNNPKRWFQRLNAMLFVHDLLNAEIKKIALENPVGAISTYIRQPDQYIEPYEFGHPETKKTGLWLKNLPPLKPADIVEPQYIIGKDGKRYSPTHYTTFGKDKWKIRSKTFPGIAKAMAEQWG